MSVSEHPVNEALTIAFNVDRTAKAQFASERLQAMNLVADAVSGDVPTHDMASYLYAMYGIAGDRSWPPLQSPTERCLRALSRTFGYENANHPFAIVSSNDAVEIPERLFMYDRSAIANERDQSALRYSIQFDSYGPQDTCPVYIGSVFVPVHSLELALEPAKVESYDLPISSYLWPVNISRSVEDGHPDDQHLLDASQQVRFGEHIVSDAELSPDEVAIKRQKIIWAAQVLRASFDQ